jgi:hypothetical protein
MQSMRIQSMPSHLLLTTKHFWQAKSFLHAVFLVTSHMLTYTHTHAHLSLACSTNLSYPSLAQKSCFVSENRLPHVEFANQSPSPKVFNMLQIVGFNEIGCLSFLHDLGFYCNKFPPRSWIILQCTHMKILWNITLKYWTQMNVTME